MENTENKFGKKTRMILETDFINGKTILKDSYFTAPLKTMQPFYTPPFMQIMVLSASAGLMAGDDQDILIKVSPGSSLELLSQSYEKIHKMDTGYAKRNTTILVEENGFLKYRPQPVIPFAHSSFVNKMTVFLKDDTSGFILTDILSCGRYKQGERFQYDRYQSLVEIYKSKRLIYRDNTRYEPEKMDLEGFGFLEGYTHMGTAVICNLSLEDDFVRQTREFIDCFGSIHGGVSRLESGDILVRICGGSAQELEQVIDEIIKKINIR